MDYNAFWYKFHCDICDHFEDQKEKYNLQIHKCFLPNGEIIGIFHGEFYVPVVEKNIFNISRVSLLRTHESG